MPVRQAPTVSGFRFSIRSSDSVLLVQRPTPYGHGGGVREVREDSITSMAQKMPINRNASISSMGGAVHFCTSVPRPRMEGRPLVRLQLEDESRVARLARSPGGTKRRGPPLQRWEMCLPDSLSRVRGDTKLIRTARPKEICRPPVVCVRVSISSSVLT